jgi:hypothetical protein
MDKETKLKNIIYSLIGLVLGLFIYILYLLGFVKQGDPPV